MKIFKKLFNLLLVLVISLPISILFAEKASAYDFGYSITCEDNFSEDFTGAHNTEIPTDYWFSDFGNPGKYFNNKLKMYVGQAGSYPQPFSMIIGPDVLEDFSMQTTVSDFEMPIVDASHSYYADFGVNSPTLMHSTVGVLRTNGTTEIRFYLGTLAGDPYSTGVTIPEVSSINLKFTKVGDVYSGYYDIGNGWTFVGSKIYAFLHDQHITYSHSGYENIDSSVSFDDLSVNCIVPPLGSTVTTPEMVEFGGDLYIFKTGSDNSLKMKVYDGTTWSDWELVGYTTAPPTATVLGTDMYIAKKGIDGSVKVKSFNGTVWTDWTELGGVTLSNPVLSTYGSSLYISKRGALNELKIKSYNGTTWSDWDTVGYSVSPPSMKEYNSDFYLVKRGIDQSLKAKSYNGTIWTEWTDLGGVATSTPVAEVYGGNLYVAKKGSDNNIRVKSYDGATWGEWTAIGSTRVSPGMTTFNGNLYVAKNGEDGSLRLKSYDGTTWGAEWSKVGDVEFKPVD